MRVAVQQEDLQLLGRTLQEQLLAEVPSGEVFQIKCAVNKNELMILTQHPVGITVDTKQIFAVLEEVLQSLPTYRDQRVQCFLRVVGEKLPYAQHSLIMKGQGSWGEQKDKEDISSSSSVVYSPLTEEEPFDPLAGAPDLLNLQPKFSVKPIFLGAAFIGIIMLGGGAYLLTRPCVMFECKEIEIAQALKTESRQLTSRAKSENELVTLQQQLETTSATLANIPRWSPRYQQVKELKVSLSRESVKINQVVKALQTASVAEQKMQATANSLEELQVRQHLWRQAIAPLEAINPNSELYGLVQPKLLKYRVGLQTINQQLLTQEKWVKKLTASIAVAGAAAKREATAKSLNDWQKVQSTWQVAVNALNIIPQTSPAYPEAQKLLVEYKPKLAATRDRTTKEELAAKTYQQAVSTANQAKTYEQQNQWQTAVTYWDQALQTAKQISQDSFYYNQSQSLIEPYSAALKQAQAKLQLTSNEQQTRADLENTCLSGIRICTFIINDKGIAVRITPEYQQKLQSNLSNPNPQDLSPVVGAANHWQVLQEALTVISDNSHLPLFVYDTQGQVIYMRTPGG